MREPWTQAMADAHNLRVCKENKIPIAFVQRAEHENYHHPSRSPEPQLAFQNEPVGQATGEEGHANRFHVRVVSFRRRLLDPDNLCPKYFVDCLRYAGLIPDDRAEDIALETRQEKVKTREEERTEITVERL